MGDLDGVRAIRSPSSALAAPRGAGPPRRAGRPPCGGEKGVAAAHAAQRFPSDDASAGQAQEPRRLSRALGLCPRSVFLPRPGPSVGAEEADGGSAVLGESGRREPRAAALGGGRGGSRRPNCLGELGWAPVAAELGAARRSAHSSAPGFVCGISLSIPPHPPSSFFCLFPSSPLLLERSGKCGPRGQREVCSACIISAYPGRDVIPLLTSSTQ